MKKKFKPTSEPCQDTDLVSLCWHGCYFPGTGSQLAAVLVSSVVIFLELCIVLLPFFPSPIEKHVMLFNMARQLSHHFNFFQGEAPHTEIHNAAQ